MTLVPCATPVTGYAVSHDVVADSFTVEGPTGARRIRPWTWGERRRLLDACVSEGVFDRDRFVAALCALVVAPAPAADDSAGREALALIALHLFGVDEDRLAFPLTDAEVTMAGTFGWRPAAFDREPAPPLDRLVAAVMPAGATVGPAWPAPAAAATEWATTTIVVDDDG